MTQTLILTLLVPLLAAVVSTLARKKSYRDYISLAGSGGYLLAVMLLAGEVLSKGPVSYQAGGWPAPYGITLIADSLTVFMLLMTAAVSLAVNIYSTSYVEGRGKESGYYAFLHFMVTGMSGAFITGDLFNLFVMFEIALMSSYALVAYSGSKESMFISLKYIVLNLIGSSLMLVAIGGLYSVTGTLNMADMAVVLSESSVNMTPVLGLSLVLFCVFGIKSGLVPFHFWAPPVYSNSPPPASALMAGISKKVGIYAVIRLYITVFSSARMPGDAVLFAGQPVNMVTGKLVAVMAVATVLIGGISALNGRKLDKLLSYSSVGQVGFIFIPISLAMTKGSQPALIASIVYIAAHGLAKPALFMISGIIESLTGTTDLDNLGGISETSFLLPATFLVSAFSLIGIPPLLGFFAKFLVFRSAVQSGSVLLVTVALFGGVATLVYFGKAWLEGFFGEPVESSTSEVARREIYAVIILTVLLIVLGVNMELMYSIAEKAAEAALDTQTYTQTVLGDGA